MENLKQISLGSKCLQDFGEGFLRICTVVEVNYISFTIIADGLGWKMSNIPIAKFRPYNKISS